MRIFFYGFLISFLLVGTAYAEELNIGGEVIEYSLPQGYVLAGDQKPYSTIRKFLAKASPRDLQLLALCVSKEGHENLMKGGDQGLKDYFIISTSRQLRDKTLSLKEFAELKKGLRKVQEQMQASVKRRANDLIGKASGGSMEVGDIATLGAFDDTDTAVSFMMLTDQVTREGNRRQIDKQAAVSTSLLTKGKFVIINQYREIDPSQDIPAQLDAFKTYARKTLEELRIEQGTPRGSFLPKLLGMTLGAAVIGGLIGLIVTRIRKKRAQGA